MKRTAIHYWIAIAALSLASGCGRNQSAAPAATTSRPNATANVQLSEEECLAFAEAFETAVHDRNAAEVSDALDWDAILDAMTATLGLSPASLTGFRRGVLQAVNSDRGLAAELIRQMEAGGSYRFLRIRERDGQKTVLFRLIGPAGINYHELLLSKSTGRVRASDVFIYLVGERLSETLHRSALPMAQQESKSWLEKLTSTESAYVKNYGQVKQMLDLLHDKRHREVLAVYGQMPPELKRDKTVLLARYQSAVFVGPEEIIAALDDFRREFPSDACIDFLLIDYYTARAEYDQLLASVDRLDRAVGGDPYLDSLRGLAAFRQGERTKAFELAENAVNGAPDIVATYWNLIGMAAEAKDYDRVLLWLRQTQERTGLRFKDIRYNPVLAEFSLSPQGVEWARPSALGTGQEAR